MLEDIDLLERIANDLDRRALAELYDRYARSIYALAWKSLGSVEESEEVVLDVFAQVWRSAKTFDPQRGKPMAWLFNIARSRVLDRLRKRQRQGKITEAIATATEIDFPTSSVDPFEDVEIAERRDLIRRALSTLPHEQRQAIEMAYYQGWSHQEIASATGISLGTIKTRIRLGLNKLRSAIDRENLELSSRSSNLN
jgi:RNA polymerase sigma-70 factor (ECF subfamily)